MPHPRTILALTILLSLITATPHAHAENIVFPPDAGVVDVTQPPYRATPDDDTDDTAAIQRALDDHPSGNAIIYLPNGTYRVTDTLRWPDGPRGGLEQKRVILQGQSRDGAILRVPDNHANFNDPAKPRAVIWTGRKPAQRFRNAIRNLTVDTGSGNGGAIGVQFIANNQGCVRRVHIRSGNGAGLIGLDMAHTDEIGPLLVKHLRVTGFNIGIKTYWPVNSVTFEHITLENQNKIGWENYGQKVYVRGLTSRNAVPVLLNKKDGWSGVVLLDADLRGEGDAADKPAIINNKGMAVRDIRTTGYKMAIRHWDKGRGNQPGVDGPNVDDWQSHDSPTRLFDAPATPTPRLPIEETPEIPWGPLTEWASPLKFGGKPGDDIDDTEAIQRAIDSGATTVYLPNGRWLLNGELVLRHNVHRLIGCEARVHGDGAIRVADGAAPAVIIERIESRGGWNIRHDSPRTLVLASGMFAGYHPGRNAGKLFIEDIVLGASTFRNQQVWARQLNIETDTESPDAKQDAKVINDAGRVWILGLKTEKPGTAIKTINAGVTELHGGFLYRNTGKPTDAAFICDNATMTITGANEARFGPNRTRVYLRHTRGDTTRELQQRGRSATVIAE